MKNKKGPTWTKKERKEIFSRIKANAGEPGIPQEQAKAYLDKFFQDLQQNRPGFPSTNQSYDEGIK